MPHPQSVLVDLPLTDDSILSGIEVIDMSTSGLAIALPADVRFPVGSVTRARLSPSGRPPLTLTVAVRQAGTVRRDGLVRHGLQFLAPTHTGRWRSPVSSIGFRGSPLIERQGERADAPSDQGVGVHNRWWVYPGYSPTGWGPHDAGPPTRWVVDKRRDAAVRVAGGQLVAALWSSRLAGCPAPGYNAARGTASCTFPAGGR